MKRLNNHGVSLIEIIVTFAIVMVIVGGLMTVIMNYRLQAQSSFSKLDLQTYKNTLTKEIQDDILNLGISDINNGGSCASTENQSRFSSCANLVFKDGTQKILAVSKVGQDDRDSLEKKYIFYDDEKHIIHDSLPKKIPEGRHAIDFQNIFVYDGNFVSSDSTFLSSGAEVKIFSIDIPIEHIDYEEDFGLHIVASNADFLSTNAMISEFKYTGNYQEYTAPGDGTYRIELWGASGGNVGTYLGGKGAYTSGYIALKKGQVLYVYVGGKGTNSDNGGYNGGQALRTGQSTFGASGGGATDVRLIGGSWDSFDGLKSRIMVAAGGGGANYRNVTSDSDQMLYGSGNGGAGGGIVGYPGEGVSYRDTTGAYASHGTYSYGTGGTQTSGGGKQGIDSLTGAKKTYVITGGFGKALSSSTVLAQSGGGGGWYVGGCSDNAAAGGGSSYISGHPGCQAINSLATTSETNISHKAVSEYDSFVFNDTTMIDGEGYVWTSSKTPTAKEQMPANGVTTVNEGNEGDGYARITYLGL